MSYIPGAGDIDEDDGAKQDRDLYQACGTGEHSDGKKQSSDEMRKSHIMPDQYYHKRTERGPV